VREHGDLALNSRLAVAAQRRHLLRDQRPIPSAFDLRPLPGRVGRAADADHPKLGLCVSLKLREELVVGALLYTYDVYIAVGWYHRIEDSSGSSTDEGVTRLWVTTRTVVHTHPRISTVQVKGHG
jgi:hypothetical protein